MGKARERRERRKNRQFNWSPLLLAVTAIVCIMFGGHVIPVFTEAYADDKLCEDGKDCYVAYHVDHEKKDRCTAKENNQWVFYRPLQPCGEDKPNYTNTPHQQRATRTPEPKEPTATNEPEKPTATLEEATEEAPTATQAKGKPTATATAKPTEAETKKDPTATLEYGDPGDEDTYVTPTPTATLATATLQQVDDDCEWCLMARWFLSLFERLVITEEQETNYMATQVSK